MKISILAVGKSRGADAELCAEYLKRLKGKISIKEIATSDQKSEDKMLQASLPSKAFTVLCDERGKDLSSRDFAAKFASWQERGTDLVFAIAGADGFTNALRARADFTLSFGRATWPHRFVRVMLLEQIYRAQQINAGHPYHRD